MGLCECESTNKIVIVVQATTIHRRLEFSICNENYPFRRITSGKEWNRNVLCRMKDYNNNI
jgi:hypothetical protein